MGKNTRNNHNHHLGRRDRVERQHKIEELKSETDSKDVEIADLKRAAEERKADGKDVPEFEELAAPIVDARTPLGLEAHGPRKTDRIDEKGKNGYRGGIHFTLGDEKKTLGGHSVS